jgi:hypothetical protein
MALRVLESRQRILARSREAGARLTIHALFN